MVFFIVYHFLIYFPLIRSSGARLMKANLPHPAGSHLRNSTSLLCVSCMAEYILRPPPFALTAASPAPSQQKRKRKKEINILTHHPSSHRVRLTQFAELSALFTLEKVLNVFGAVSDFAIAGALIFYLHRLRTESVVIRLIVFSSIPAPAP